MLMLSAVLLEESTPLHVRNAAGLALKNALTARVRCSVRPISRPVRSPAPSTGQLAPERVLAALAVA